MAKVRLKAPGRWPEYATGRPASCKKAQEDRDAAYQKAAKGAGARLKPGYCLTLLSEGARQIAKVRCWATA